MEAGVTGQNIASADHQIRKHSGFRLEIASVPALRTADDSALVSKLTFTYLATIIERLLNLPTKNLKEFHEGPYTLHTKLLRFFLKKIVLKIVAHV